jgi:hypothetical protein
LSVLVAWIEAHGALQHVARFGELRHLKIGSAERNQRRSHFRIGPQSLLEREHGCGKIVLLVVQKAEIVMGRSQFWT